MNLFKKIETAYESFDLTVRNYLTKALNSVGIAFSNSQIYSIIFQGVKGVMQNVMFYIEDAFTEQNIETAYRRQSVYSLARLSGYEPSYGSAAVGTLTMRYPAGKTLPSGSTRLYIQNRSVLTNAKTGIHYSICIPTEYYVIDLLKPLLTHQFKIVQGEWHSASYISAGVALETVKISSAQYDSEYVEVYVDGKKWSSAASLYDMRPDGEEYMCKTGYDSSFEITFGDGVYGRKLSEGQTVIVRYIAHAGSAGNALDTDSADFRFVSSIYDSAGDAVDASEYLLLSMDSQISGGTDPDSVETVRKMAGCASRSLVIASEDNFRLFLSRFSFIGQCSIWVEPDSLNVTLACFRNFKKELISPEDYFSIDSKDALLPDNYKTMVKSAFENSKKTFAGVNLVFANPAVRKYAAVCYAKLGSSYNRTQASVDIRRSLAGYFMSLENDVSFIPKSDLINKVTADVPYLTSFDLSFISEQNESGYRDGYVTEYEERLNAGTYAYSEVRKAWEKDVPAGLDAYGNIVVKSKMELPLLHGGFKYYPYKDEPYKAGETEDITTESVQIIYI